MGIISEIAFEILDGAQHLQKKKKSSKFSSCSEVWRSFVGVSNVLVKSTSASSACCFTSLLNSDCRVFYIHTRNIFRCIKKIGMPYDLVCSSYVCDKPCFMIDTGLSQVLPCSHIFNAGVK